MENGGYGETDQQSFGNAAVFVKACCSKPVNKSEVRFS
jgi:hypothetical protein